MITVSGNENIEEVYFLLRTATWHQEHFQQWLDLKEEKVYEVAYSDGMDYANDSLQDNHWEEDYNRGYEAGYEKGLLIGGDEGYKDGYQDGARESSFDYK